MRRPVNKMRTSYEGNPAAQIITGGSGISQNMAGG